MFEAPRNDYSLGDHIRRDVPDPDAREGSAPGSVTGVEETAVVQLAEARAASDGRAAV